MLVVLKTQAPTGSHPGHSTGLGAAGLGDRYTELCQPFQSEKLVFHQGVTWKSFFGVSCLCSTSERAVSSVESSQWVMRPGEPTRSV